jgi:hypothetical protein
VTINPGDKDSGKYTIKLIFTVDNKYPMSNTYTIDLTVKDAAKEEDK